MDKQGESTLAVLTSKFSDMVPLLLWLKGPRALKRQRLLTLKGGKEEMTRQLLLQERKAETE